MTQQPNILVGVRAIADYMQRGTRVVRRLIRTTDLPVTLEEGSYMTTREAIDEWVKNRALKRLDTKRHSMTTN